MADDFLAGAPTRHASLLGVGAALDRLTGGADLYARQQRALDAAADAVGYPPAEYLPGDIERLHIRDAIDAYLRSMCESEASC